MTREPLLQVGELFGHGVFAQRTEAGGMAYFTDDVGGGQCIVDFTVVDADVLQFVLNNQVRLERLYDDAIARADSSARDCART